MKYRIKRFVFILIVLCAGITLAGCGENQPAKVGEKNGNVSADFRNVEERDYATILIVEKNKSGRNYHFTVGTARERRVGEKNMNEKVSKWDCSDLWELAELYQNEKGKDLSLAHLKVIFVVPQKDRYVEDSELLYMLQNDVEVAKTVPMMLLRDSGEFLDCLDEAEEPVAKYIENLTAVKNEKGKDVNTVADYLKAWRENESIIPDYFAKGDEGYKIV